MSRAENNEILKAILAGKMDFNVDVIADSFEAIVFVFGAFFYLVGSQALGVLLMVMAVVLFLITNSDKLKGL